MDARVGLSFPPPPALCACLCRLPLLLDLLSVCVCGVSYPPPCCALWFFSLPLALAHVARAFFRPVVERPNYHTTNHRHMSDTDRGYGQEQPPDHWLLCVHVDAPSTCFHSSPSTVSRAVVCMSYLLHLLVDLLPHPRHAEEVRRTHLLHAHQHNDNPTPCHTSVP